MYNYLTTAVRIIQLQPFLSEYCLNLENHKKCARYKMKEKGEKPSADLLPDGKKIKL